MISVTLRGADGAVARGGGGHRIRVRDAQSSARLAFVAPGRHSIYFSIFDQGDSVVDSAAFVDRLALVNVPADDCTPGARADTVAPG